MTYDELTYSIRGAIYEVYKALGPGLLESVYEKALLHELKLRGLHPQNQVRIPLVYKDATLGADLIMDLLVNDSVVLELKSVETIMPVHKKQLLTYLKLADKRIGYLVNFNESDIDKGITHIVNNYNRFEIIPTTNI